VSNLDGKVAVITGSSKGIGASIAERLSRDGASVVVNYSRSADFAESVVQRIKSSGGRAVAVQADVSNPSEIAKLFSLTTEGFGGLDILVNNAGVYKFAPLRKLKSNTSTSTPT
jgi:3-oxoacyl-[acyl-carrier protein] reductase